MRYFSLFLACCLSLNVFAQVELEFLSQTSYPEDVILNDIWGYADETTGSEYALVGLTTGLSIIDVTDPVNPDSLFFIEGPQSTWRDIKTYGNFAYTVTEAEAGLLVADLSMLPDSISYNYTTLNDELSTAHNIWIDEFGFAYVCGYNNVGDSLASAEKGALILDLTLDPWEPPVAGSINEKYFHDIFVRDNILYSSDINEGTFSIWDVSDKENIVFMANRTTPNEFTHNAWLSDNGNFLFTTDERSNGTVASYNISDLSDIREEHLYRSDLGSGKIPHNAHVLNDWIVISYYTDGVRIVDAHNPEILVETAFYDTSPSDAPGFAGCWGVYPFLPSGNILASDRQEGLIVTGPGYQRAAYIQGIVSDEETDASLQFVEVTVQATNSQVQSNNFGLYKTGTTFDGTSAEFDITFERFGYFPETIEGITLTKELVETIDVELTPKPLSIPTIIFQDANTGETIDGVYSQLQHLTGSSLPPLGFFEDTGFSDAEGQVEFSELRLEETYTLSSSRWGYRSIQMELEIVDTEPIIVELEPGFFDVFFYASNEEAESIWTTQTFFDELTTDGDWEFVNVESGSGHFWPNNDSPDDFGIGFYTTGANFDGTNGIVNDSTTLISPPMDLSTIENPILAFDAYLFATNIDWVPSRGSFDIEITDGETRTFLMSFPDTATQFFTTWEHNEIMLSDFVTPTDNMQVLFTVHNESTDYFYLDASIDRFEIREGPPLFAPDGLENQVNIYPNPSSDNFNIDFTNQGGRFVLKVYDLQSRLVETLVRDNPSSLTFGSELLPGMYVLRVERDGELIGSRKLAKTQ